MYIRNAKSWMYLKVSEVVPTSCHPDHDCTNNLKRI